MVIDQTACHLRDVRLLFLINYQNYVL